MVGYSRLIGLDDVGALERLKRHNLIDPAITEHGGRIVQTRGDSLLVRATCHRIKPSASGSGSTLVTRSLRVFAEMGQHCALGEPGEICAGWVVRDRVRDRKPLVSAMSVISSTAL